MSFIIFYGLQILEQATYRLELTQAARRFYAADGTIILDLDDLIDWVKQQYVKEAKQQIKEEARRKKKQQQQQTQQANDKKTDAKKGLYNTCIMCCVIKLTRI